MDSKTIYERDSDQDGLTDAQELALGTNPFSSDSDGDGKTDLEEVQSCDPPMIPQKERRYDLDL
ncbi:TPA: calcium-binding protein [Streptococcus agalactiae]